MVNPAMTVSVHISKVVLEIGKRTNSLLHPLYSITPDPVRREAGGSGYVEPGIAWRLGK